MFKHTRNINFDYFYDSKKIRISPALYRDTSTTNNFLPNAASLLKELGLSLQTTYVFLLFPLCTLLITFLRNIVGIKTFGIFMPMLIAAASVYTGLFTGLVGFVSVLLLAFMSHAILGKFNILKIPRLASIITITTIVSLIGISNFAMSQHIEFGLLALFPVVVISFAADRIHQMAIEDNWQDIQTPDFDSGIPKIMTDIIATYERLTGLEPILHLSAAYSLAADTFGQEPLLAALVHDLGKHLIRPMLRLPLTRLPRQRK